MTKEERDTYILNSIIEACRRNTSVAAGLPLWEYGESESDYGTLVCRVDGVELWYSYEEASDYDKGFTFKCSSVRDAMLEYDRRYPIPHPGFRVGQIWALNGYDMVQLTSLSDVTKRQLHSERYPFLVHDTLYPERAPWYDVVKFHGLEPPEVSK